MEEIEKRIAIDGKSVEVQVYNDDAGGWLLEIVDEYSNSTCWQSPFETAQDAFDEANRAIKEEGIDTFIGAGKNMKDWM